MSQYVIIFIIFLINWNYVTPIIMEKLAQCKAFDNVL